MIRAFLLFATLLAVVSAIGIPSGGDCEGESKCPPGYKLFKARKNGPWCMKYFPGNMTWWEAERECRCSTKGAHLSGIESSQEKKWLEGEAQNQMDDANIKDGSVWIGAYRRKDCPSGQESTWSKKTECSHEKLFQFTDRHTCGTYIYQDWASGQPTSAAGDDCGVIMISTETSGANADNSGKAADKNCLQVSGPTAPLSSVGFVCGVKPIQSGGGSGYGGGDMVFIGAGKPEKKQ